MIASDENPSSQNAAEMPSGPIVSGLKKKSVPAGLWTKCPSCQYVMFNKSLKDNLYVCLKCDYHFIMRAQDRIQHLLDPKSFEEHDTDLVTQDPLGFSGVKPYLEKLKQDQKKTGLKEACVTGEGKMGGKAVAFGVTDSRFIMGSMGSVVGEKITRLVEFATERKIPLIIISGSGGGARMYEGALSLMQMAKTSMALSRYQAGSKPFISVLTNPTMGGVMASFSSLGDIIIAEPKALIGFAGPRVIEQTIRQKLPNDFQTSEFLLEHGMIDMVVDRRSLRERLSLVLEYAS
ncbi:MAG TPA: acetyl-CoA carboxylase, carboxyltransferase subunit beta [Verrucomicrobiae bacterium]|jgi:acetyl-CoA carboxylase carboxyl transferase subunit beta|nr:acetyl-CoA carboxylase, carboxyltransferase subunit beta [Verrucomicrobiae bacterium]